jgi:hypothetical protein
MARVLFGVFLSPHRDNCLAVAGAQAAEVSGFDFVSVQVHVTEFGSAVTSPTKTVPAGGSAVGIALAGVAFLPCRCVSVPRALMTAFMEYRPAGAMMRLSP